MENVCFFNGEIISTNKCSIGIADLGIQRGYAVFDYARTFNKKLFHFDDHLLRLRSSANELRLPVKYTNENLTAIASELINSGKYNNPAVRIIVTGGYVNPSSRNFEPNIIMTIEEVPAYDPSLYTHGAKLTLFEFARELPHVKSTNYLNDLRLNSLRNDRKVFDILYYSGNGISECPRSNFFLFINDKLVTPKKFILEGVTRKIIIGLASMYWEVEERTVTVDELKSADESFITSTTKNIMPVSAIDSIVIGEGLVGQKTRKLIQLFKDYSAGVS